MQIKHNQVRILILIATIASITSCVAGAVLWLLYQDAIRNYSERLQEAATAQTILVTSVLALSGQNPELSEQPLQTVLQVLRRANESFTGIGRTGELTLAGRQNNDVAYYHSQRHQGQPGPDLVLFRSPLSMPMQKALAGESGLMIGQDYRGIFVLAAYEPIPELGLGTVAKIDMAEIRQPFLRAMMLSALAGLILILLGTAFYLRINERISIQENILQTRYQHILDNALDGIITINKYGNIQSINKAALQMFGYHTGELEGKNVNLLMTGALRDVHDSYVQKIAHNKAKPTALGNIREVEGLRKDSSTFPVDIALSRTDIGGEILFTGIVRNMSERKRASKATEEYRDHLEDQVEKRTQALTAANKKLEKLANLDGLTGIANRRVFDNVLKREWRRAQRQKTVMSLAMCDVDYFKNYNDTYGHLSGDECLKTLATTMQNLFQRAGDLVTRYGGEEFAIILPDVPYQGLISVVEQLRESIWALNIKHLRPDGTDRVTISIGAVTVHPTLELAEQDLIKYADDALYQAKQDGRNRVHTIELH